jgi:hypothetical protein
MQTRRSNQRDVNNTQIYETQPMPLMEQLGGTADGARDYAAGTVHNILKRRDSGHYYPLQNANNLTPVRVPKKYMREDEEVRLRSRRLMNQHSRNHSIDNGQTQKSSYYQNVSACSVACNWI